MRLKIESKFYKTPLSCPSSGSEKDKIQQCPSLRSLSPSAIPDGWEQMGAWRGRGITLRSFFGRDKCDFPLDGMSWAQSMRGRAALGEPGCSPWFLSPSLGDRNDKPGAGSCASGLGFAQSPAGKTPEFPFPTVSPTACTQKSTEELLGRAGKGEISAEHRKSPWGNDCRDPSGFLEGGNHSNQGMPQVGRDPSGSSRIT